MMTPPAESYESIDTWTSGLSMRSTVNRYGSRSGMSNREMCEKSRVAFTSVLSPTYCREGLSHDILALSACSARLKLDETLSQYRRSPQWTFRVE